MRVLGYKTSTSLAREKGLLTERQIQEILSPERMANPLD